MEKKYPGDFGRDFGTPTLVIWLPRWYVHGRSYAAVAITMTQLLFLMLTAAIRSFLHKVSQALRGGNHIAISCYPCWYPSTIGIIWAHRNQASNLLRLHGKHHHSPHRAFKDVVAGGITHSSELACMGMVRSIPSGQWTTHVGWLNRHICCFEVSFLTKQSFHVKSSSLLFGSHHLHFIYHLVIKDGLVILSHR